MVSASSTRAATTSRPSGEQRTRTSTSIGGNLPHRRHRRHRLTVHGSQHVLWWGFYLHDSGSTGFAAFTAPGHQRARRPRRLPGHDHQGRPNLAWDPHCANECGTGLHGAILWDGATRRQLHQQPVRLLRPRHPHRRLRRARQRPTRLAGSRQRPLPEVRQRDRGRQTADGRERLAAVGRHRQSRPRHQVPRSRPCRRPRPRDGRALLRASHSQA